MSTTKRVYTRAPPTILLSPPAAPSLVRRLSPKPGRTQQPDRFKRWWKKSRDCVYVLDGGSCYFEVKYDVQSGEIYDLSIHGEA